MAATTAQCAYCFECLSASLERRKPLALEQTEELWELYETGGNDDNLIVAQQKAENGQVPKDEEMEDAKPDAENSDSSYRPAAISRLLNPSSSSSSSSATSSTPSLNSSAASKSSSRTSLFSLPRRVTRNKKSSATEYESEEYPLFVTWNTVNSRGHKSLRGCIGTFEPHELDDGLRSYSLTSAFEDTRFHPISPRELPSLDCGITLLTDFEPIQDPMDWEVGVHGLRISFVHNGRRYGATYLPDVASEQGWTKEETIVSLMRKAGWNGRSSEWRGVRDLSCVRYQGYKASLGYREWKEWRDWVTETGRELELDV